MDDTRIVLSVSELNQCARTLLEESFNQVWIEGEISNLSQPSSGHCYFTLKDANAQIRCALFRLQQQRLKFKLANGLQVLVRAQVSLYEARGDYQLIVSHAEPAGDGLLQRAYEQLKKKLEAEGLFAEIHKKALPEFPKQIGIITSATGAAIRDILQVLQRRCINIPVVIYPSQVQGERAAAQLIAAVELANQRRECDILILARGGGSLVDLWPFNDEKLAYAIFNSEIPIISGVGHEVDFTIADFIADRRAPTPSAAAELASPNQAELIGILKQYSTRLLHLVKMNLQQAKTRLVHLSKLLKSPAQRLKDQAQHLDLIEKRLQLQMQHSLEKLKQHLHFLSSKLDAISPLRTLERGYAIITQAKDESLVRDAAELRKGDVIEAKLAKGRIKAEVLG